METAVEESTKDNLETEVHEKDVKESNAIPPPQDLPKKTKKEDRKKEDKSIEQFMKSLNSVPSLEEKLSLVCRKYVQSTDDNKKLQFYIKQSDKRHAMLTKEKEQLQQEYNKAILLKSKLENLCRELQKQNKTIKEESLLRIREEEERRKETQAKFQSTFTEITTLLQQNNDRNAQLRDDNMVMTEKFQSIVEKYQLRDEQVEKMAKQMALESQLSKAKIQMAAMEHQAEKERMLAEMEEMKVMVAQYRAKTMELEGVEKSLRAQLAIYSDKYDEFQGALVKSHQVFGGFKEQMEKMSKKIKKLEKESLSWKSKWQSSQSALLELCEERQAQAERAASCGRQLAHMQGLCRALQAERTNLINCLKEHNIERPPAPVLPSPPPPQPVPAPSPSSNAKVDAMAANCVQLRQSLAHLQTQLNTITNKQEGAREEPAKEPIKEKQKKNKSKKSKNQKSVQEKDEHSESSTEKETQAVEITDTEVKEDVETEKEKEKIEEKTNEKIDEKIDDKIVDKIDVKIDDKTIEKLMEAITNANINLCDLEVNGENDEEKCNVSFIEANAGEEITRVGDLSSNDEVSHITEVKPITNDAIAS